MIILEQLNVLEYFISDQLKKQVGSIFSHIRKGKYNRTLFAAEDNKLFAIAVSWSNPFHPHAEYLRVYLDDSVKESNELKNQILERLETSSPSTADRFIYTLMSTQISMIRTLESHHYELIRKTYEPEWTLDQCLNKLSISAHTNTLSYKEVFQDAQLKNQLITLLKQNYENTHLVNPTADMTLYEWKTFLLNEEPDLELSLVSLDDQGITAYVTIFQSESSVEVAWLGMREAYPTSFLSLKCLFKTQLLLFKQLKINVIEPEIDTTDHFALGLFSFIDYLEEESFQTYRKFI